MVSLRPFSSLHAVKAPAQDLPHRVHGATFCSRGKFVEDLGKIMIKATAAEFEDVSDKIRTYHAQATISNHCTYQLLSNTNILPAPQKSRQCKGQSNNIQRSVKVSKHMSLELPLQSAELQCKARRFFAQTFPIPVIGTQSP